MSYKVEYLEFRTRTTRSCDRCGVAVTGADTTDPDMPMDVPGDFRTVDFAVRTGRGVKDVSRKIDLCGSCFDGLSLTDAYAAAKTPGEYYGVSPWPATG